MELILWNIYFLVVKLCTKRACLILLELYRQSDRPIANILIYLHPQS